MYPSVIIFNPLASLLLLHISLFFPPPFPPDLIPILRDARCKQRGVDGCVRLCVNIYTSCGRWKQLDSPGVGAKDRNRYKGNADANQQGKKEFEFWKTTKLRGNAGDTVQYRCFDMTRWLIYETVNSIVGAREVVGRGEESGGGRCCMFNVLWYQGKSSR